MDWTDKDIKEFYHSELLAAKANGNNESYWKELYRDSVMKELEQPYNLRHDKLPFYKFIYLN